MSLLVAHLTTSSGLAQCQGEKNKIKSVIQSDTMCISILKEVKYLCKVFGTFHKSHFGLFLFVSSKTVVQLRRKPLQDSSTTPSTFLTVTQKIWETFRLGPKTNTGLGIQAPFLASSTKLLNSSAGQASLMLKFRLFK